MKATPTMNAKLAKPAKKHPIFAVFAFFRCLTRYHLLDGEHDAARVSDEAGQAIGRIAGVES